MTYAGNRLFNFNNVILIAFLAFTVYVFINIPNHNSLLPYYVLAGGIFATAIEAFYFEIASDELIVRNYMIPFFKTGYRLDEITLIRFVATGYRSSSIARIRIIRGDKQSYRFSAASLKTNDWQLFVNELSAKKIPVDIQATVLKSAIGVPED